MKLRTTIWALVAAVALCATAASAQDQNNPSPIDPNAPLQPLDTTPNTGRNPNQPVGVVRGVVGGPDQAQQQTYDPSQVIPDQNTLAGAAPYTLGSLQHTRNSFDPAISFSQIGQAVPGNTGQTVLVGESLVSGSLNFNRIWAKYRFTTVYDGGETFNLGYGSASTFFGVNSPHYQYHNLSVAQEATWARWHILLRDDFTASPGAAFTSQGMGGPGLTSAFSSMLGTSLSSLGQQFEPTETVNTGQVMRFRDSILGQAEYSFTRRTAFTFAGSYGVLDFANSGYFNSNMVDGQAGLDYMLDPFNSIAVLGTFGKINFSGTGVPAVGTITSGTGNSIEDYGGALAYGRRITGRLALQAAAGPQEIETFTPGGSGNFHKLFVSVNSALTYERRRGGVSLSYSRGLTGGSGVTLGATSKTVSASTRYQFTRFWSGGVNAGYSLDDSLAPAGAAPTQYDNWFVGANIGRRLGLHAAFNFSYGATRQNNAAICLVANCGGVGLQQTVGLSVNWHLRPAG